jgi:F-type H+-transporting ATPase subunit b
MAFAPEAAPSGAEHTATTEAAAGHKSAGLPQFDVAWWPGQMVWLLLVFVVLLALMKLIFVPRVSGAIEARDGRIAEDIAQARRLKDEAQAQAAQAASETAQARAGAQKLAAEAKARAQAAATARQAQEEDRLAQTTATAEEGIRAAREQALAHVRDIAADTAQAIVERLSGRPASAAEVQQAFVGRA